MTRSLGVTWGAVNYAVNPSRREQMQAYAQRYYAPEKLKAVYETALREIAISTDMDEARKIATTAIILGKELT